MFSLPVQRPSFVLHNRCSTTFSNTLLVDHKPFSRPSSALVELRIKSTTRIHRLPVAEATAELAVAEATAELAVAETPDEISDVLLVQDTQDATRSFEKPRLVLKFIWMDKNIGLGLDQVLPRYGTVPLSPYFFWPRKDAWEELKATLESKPWISQKKMIILLNQATDIINLWQQSGGNLS